MAKERPSDDLSIDKFDILATYTFAQALRDGMTDEEAKQRGMVAAIMGAQARLGIRREHHEEFRVQKEAAEKKKKTTITAESFDRQVADKMGEFFDDVFPPVMTKLIEAGLSYTSSNNLTPSRHLTSFAQGVEPRSSRSTQENQPRDGGEIQIRILFLLRVLRVLRG